MSDAMSEEKFDISCQEAALISNQTQTQKYRDWKTNGRYSSYDRKNSLDLSNHMLKAASSCELSSAVENEWQTMQILQTRFRRFTVVKITQKTISGLKVFQHNAMMKSEEMNQVKNIYGMVKKVESLTEIVIEFPWNKSLRLHPDLLSIVNMSDEIIEAGDIVVVVANADINEKLGHKLQDERKQHCIGESGIVQMVHKNTVQVAMHRGTFQWHPLELKIWIKRDKVMKIISAQLRRIKWPDTVQGMFIKDNKIYFDIFEVKGGEEEMNFRMYLSVNCYDIFRQFHIDQNTAVIIRTLTAPFKFQVASGDTIGPANEETWRAVQQGEVAHACLSEMVGQAYGTVGLIAQEVDTLEHYLITARHVLNEHGGNDSIVLDPVDGMLKNVICSQDRRIVCAADKSFGILGGHGDENIFVDISVLKLTVHPEQVPEEDIELLHLLDTDTAMIAEGHQVTANGAVVANASGEIEAFDYSPVIDGQMFTDCLLIKPNAPLLQFSLPGDSGALVTGVIAGRLYALGLVCRGTDSPDDPHIFRTIVVKLHNCFNAINEKFNLKLRISERWKNCRIVYPSPSTEFVDPLEAEAV